MGDIVCSNKIDPKSYLKKLSGRKHLILGNHDLRHRGEDFDSFFESIDSLKFVKDGKNSIILCHYPLAEWSGYYSGSYHIFGHVHNNDGPVIPLYKANERMLNAGVDINNFMPVAFEQLVINNNIYKSYI